MNIYKEIAAATAVVGYDLLTNERLNKVGFARTIIGIGMCGSAAAGDTEAELFVNGRSEGKFRNTATGTAIQADRDLKRTDIFIPANAQVEFKVTDAAATNPVAIQIEFGKPARSTARRSGGYRRGYRRTGSRASGGYNRGFRSSGMY